MIKGLNPNRFIGEFSQTFKKEIKPILYSLFHRLKVGGILVNAFYEASISLTLKLDKDIIRKLHTNVFHEHRCKNLQQNMLNT